MPMVSPFLGMDPYLEGSLWPDLHHRLATKITNMLVPQIRPKYVARIARYVVEDESPENEIGIMYPDVEVFAQQRNDVMRESTVAYHTANFTPVSLTIPTFKPVEVEIPVIEIKDVEGNRLITAIEILSPVNKRQPGLKVYRQKRQKMNKNGVHFIEIDLLRRGKRTLLHPKIQDAHYLVSLDRVGKNQTDCWLLNLFDYLPTIPVPLQKEDKDVGISLQRAFEECYQEAAYDLSIDYTKEPPLPKLTQEEKKWMAERLNNA